MQNFKEGDVVQLKSGGPEMTIKSFGVFTGKEGAVCVWFAGTKLERGVFSEPELKLIRSGEKGK
jgi:uncharacterized protein YodC (DUF2158 family)